MIYNFKEERKKEEVRNLYNGDMISFFISGVVFASIIFFIGSFLNIFFALAIAIAYSFLNFKLSRKGQENLIKTIFGEDVKEKPFDFYN